MELHAIFPEAESTPSASSTPSAPSALPASAAVAWRVTEGGVPYPEALRWMEAQVEGILAHSLPETVWLLEHPPLYTAGTSARPSDLLKADFPVFATGRGGQYTYHGPGQRVAYVLLDLSRRGRDVRRFVWLLEEWLIQSLRLLGVEAFRREGRVGLWVLPPVGRPVPWQEAKIAAIGVRIRKWVSFHGVAINVCPDLSHFSGIVPCGLTGFGVTSLQELGVDIGMETVDRALKAAWSRVF